MHEFPDDYFGEDPEDIVYGARSAANVGDSRAAAEYLADMIGQLESMSRTAGFDLLVYLLSMARVEAEAHARGAPRGP